jgi:hypothetical protein
MVLIRYFKNAWSLLETEESNRDVRNEDRGDVAVSRNNSLYFLLQSSSSSPEEVVPSSG